jgi:predicted amidohydrolase YtcJ
MRKYLLFIFMFATLLSCNNRKHEVDLLILGATIYSMDKDSTIYTAMAVDSGKIIALGNDAELSQKYKANCTTRLTGTFIYPGLIDAHSHFYGLGQSLVNIDLRGVESEEAMIKKVKDFYSVEKPASSKNHPTSVQGRGWDQNLWPLKKFPTNTELNQLFPDIPVFLGRIDGHAALVNQKALDLAGINENSTIRGGEFLKENGKLTGVLIDNAVDLVTSKLPQPTKEERKKSILKAEQVCLDYGLTTVCDAGLDKEIIDLYDEMHKHGELRIRIYAMANPTTPTLDWLLENGPYKTERLHVRSVKYYMDGAMGSRGACLLKDYTDQPGHKGFLLNPIDSLRALAIKIRDKNLQLNVHCIGDSANRIVLKIMAEVLGTHTTSRWRIEHMQLVNEQDLAYVEKYKIIPSMQPTHATSDASWVGERVGPERLRYAYALKTCLQKSGILALGTDFPVEQVNPFYTFYAAVHRRDPVTGKTADWLQAEKLTPYQTLQGMTIWAAYAQFEEKEKGSLEVGKLADFIVLDQDLLSKGGAKDLATLKPLSVYINGRLVAGKE